MTKRIRLTAVGRVVQNAKNIPPGIDVVAANYGADGQIESLAEKLGRYGLRPAGVKR